MSQVVTWYERTADVAYRKLAEALQTPADNAHDATPISEMLNTRFMFDVAINAEQVMLMIALTTGGVQR